MAPVSPLPAAGFRGVNVTIPHKHAALAVADRASEAARAIGAANTLTFEDGAILADNDGQTVNESSQSIAPNGPAATAFQISKPDGFPPGKYKVERKILSKKPVRKVANRLRAWRHRPPLEFPQT